MNFRIVELDGTDGDDTAQLITWITRIRDMKVLQGPTAILLDDYEGLTEDARRRVGTMLKERTDPTLAPIIITCTQLKEPRLRILQTFDAVRLFAPNEHVCKEWFDKNGFLLHTNDTGVIGTRRCFPRRGWETCDESHLVTCDLRRITIALQWRELTKCSLSSDVAANKHFTSSFQATQHLLLRKTDATHWATTAEPRDADLLREHLPKYVNDDIGALADALECLSAADVLSPARYECSSVQTPLRMHLVGQTTTCFSKARAVEALFPPARLAPTWGRTRSDQSLGKRPRTAFESIDVPALLHDPA